MSVPTAPQPARGGVLFRTLIRVSEAANHALAAVAGVALIATMIVLIANVVLRIVAAPLASTFELISMTSIVVIGLALGDAQMHRAHVSIDLLVGRFPKGVRILLGVAVTVASGAIFVQLAASLLTYGLNLRAEGAATESLAIPLWPSALVLVVGVGGLVLALGADLAKAWLARTCDDPHVNIF